MSNFKHCAFLLLPIKRIILKQYFFSTMYTFLLKDSSKKYCTKRFLIRFYYVVVNLKTEITIILFI